MQVMPILSRFEMQVFHNRIDDADVNEIVFIRMGDFHDDHPPYPNA